MGRWFGCKWLVLNYMCDFLISHHCPIIARMLRDFVGEPLIVACINISLISFSYPLYPYFQLFQYSH